MVANSLPEDTPSTLVTALLLGKFYQSKLNSAGTRRVVVSFKRRYVHEILLNRLVKLVLKNYGSTPNSLHQINTMR